MIKLLSVAIFAGLFFASQASVEPTTTLPEDNDNLARGCWTMWFDRDDPSGSGDWETLFRLRRENPGKICPNPSAIEAEPVSGDSVAAAGDVIYINDTTNGFVCRNQDQRNKICHDYHVRFACPLSYCGEKVCWTQWFDRDDPSGTGDWETLYSLRRENPGKICTNPQYIMALTADTNSTAISTGNIIFFFSPSKGFVCLNKDQGSCGCRDYKVTFGCLC